MSETFYYHLALVQDWDKAGARYEVSTRGRTLSEVGYIHLSLAHQVDEVGSAYYADCADSVLLLTIDPKLLDDAVRLEPPTPEAAELFPHLYGPLPRAAVVEVRQWKVGMTR